MWKFYVVFGVSTACLAAVGIAMVGKSSSCGNRASIRGTRSDVFDLDDRGNEEFATRNIRSLEAKLAQKDLMIASLLADKANGREPTEDFDSNDPMKSRLSATMQALDKRLEMQFASSSGDSGLGADLAAVIDDGVLQNTKMRDIRCAKNLCKLALSNENGVELNQSVISLSRSLGKAAGGFSVFNGHDGEKIVYISERGEDLIVDMPGDPSDTEIEEIVLGENTSP